MSRETYVMRGRKLVPKRRASPLTAADRGPQVISDTMSATWHPADGRRYDSKAQFRATTKAHGCIEVGTDKMTPRKPPPETPIATYRDQVRRAIYECENPWARQ